MPPFVDVGMVARQQHGRHALALPDFGAGVVRAIEQAAYAGVEAVLNMALRVAEHTGLQAGDGVQQGKGGNFAAREHKIAQADLVRDQAVYQALVYAFITATQQDGA